jgi:hypothetical protein
MDGVAGFLWDSLNELPLDALLHACNSSEVSVLRRTTHHSPLPVGHTHFRGPVEDTSVVIE